MAIAGAACATAQANDDLRFASTVPFHYCDGLICFQAGLDGGKPVTLALDTGDVDSIMFAAAARSRHWQLAPLTQDGKAMAGAYRSAPRVIQLGGLKVDTRFLVLDRKAFGGRVPPADGTLAYPVFKDRILQIDYPHHVLRISNVLTTPVTARHAAGALQLITFGRKGPPIVVGMPFTVDGQPVHAQIDTMYTGTLLVYDAALAKLGLHKHGKPTRFDYTDGGVYMLAARAKSLGFGDRTLSKAPTVYFVGKSKNSVHQPDGLFEATVENALFPNEVVTMDFHAMTLDVRPAE